MLLARQWSVPDEKVRTWVNAGYLHLERTNMRRAQSGRYRLRRPARLVATQPFNFWAQWNTGAIQYCGCRRHKDASQPIPNRIAASPRGLPKGVSGIKTGSSPCFNCPLCYLYRSNEATQPPACGLNAATA